MPQVFSPSANTVGRVIALGLPALVVILGGVWYVLWHSPYVTGVGIVVEQPVPFSHDHHVAGLGIDCRYCHTSVEESKFAGIPATEVCMNCHEQIWTNAELLEPVRESYRENKPIKWNRVHDMPDYVYFDHSIHVNKGIDCTDCHGRVDRMPLPAKAESLQMLWCLDCHRHPEVNVRPQEAMYDLDWTRPKDKQLGEKLVDEYGIDKLRLTNCTMCHR